MNITREQFAVDGMTCASCAASLESWLSHAEGVQQAAVNYAGKTLQVTYDKDKTSRELLDQKASEIGYHLITGSKEEQRDISK